MYLRVRSIWALRMVSIDSLLSAAREVWIKPHFTIRGIFRFSDLGSGIISLMEGTGDRGRGTGVSGTGAETGAGSGLRHNLAIAAKRRRIMPSPAPPARCRAGTPS